MVRGFGGHYARDPANQNRRNPNLRKIKELDFHTKSRHHACEWIHIKEGAAKSFNFHHTIYSGRELKDRMQQAGFKTIKTYGDLDGDPYDQNAKRLILLGRK